MKRRTNKSHRVPNVKLRPGEAQPSSSLAAVESSWPEDSQLRSDDTALKDTCPRPFRNVVLCATGISDKPTLFKKALELGASAISAFTDKVTHLIAVSHGGPKYKCALEHNIPIVTPAWVTDNYDIWLHGDDVETDMEKSIEPYRLPVFSDVVVCVSGIPELERRADIRRIVEQQGGSYVKAIERPVRVTHLLCSGDEETEKMRYAEKFVKRGEAQIHMVWEDWFWDSLKVQGRLEEDRYNVRNPRPSPVALRNTQPNVPDSTTNSRSNSMQAPAHGASELEDLEDEAARVKVVPDITLKVWTGLLERRGYEVSGGEILRSPSKSQSRPRSPSPIRDRRGGQRQRGGVISAVRSTNTFEPVEKEATPGLPLPFRRSSTASSSSSRQSRANSVHEPANEAGPSKPSSRSQSQQHSEQSAPSIFSGTTFVLLGEADAPAVAAAIEQSGGKVVSEKEDADILIVRLLSGSALYRSERDPNLRSRYRTECWLERCIHEERVCSIDEDVSFQPLDIALPVPGADAILIGLSGLDQSESCHTRRLLKAFGMNIIPMFSRKATHLLCPSGIGLKYNKAQEWGIPVVSNEWIASIASTGALPPPGKHLVTSDSGGDIDGKGKGRALDIPQDKGKGKLRDRSASVPAGDAMDVDKRMHDITNSGCPFSSLSTLADVPGPPTDPVEHPSHKAGGLERQPTAIIQEDKRPAKMAFGEPTELLGSMPSSSAASSSFSGHPSSLRPLTQESPLVRYGTNNSKAGSMSHTASESGLQHHLSPQGDAPPRGSFQSNKSRKLTNQPTPSRNSSTSSVGGRRRAAESTDNDDNDDNLRVPSSKSPSPMKMPVRSSSISPAKLDQGAALALQESIASLLGKRSHHEDEDEDGDLPNVDDDESVKSKGGKRKRAPRAKPLPRKKAQSRQSPQEAAPPPDVDVAISLSAFEPYGHASGANATDEHPAELDQSARVVYQDPAQQEGAQRLMSMFKQTTTIGTRSRKKADSQVVLVEEGEVESISVSGSLSARSVTSSGRVTRRSTRMSGA